MGCYYVESGWRGRRCGRAPGQTRRPSCIHSRRRRVPTGRPARIRHCVGMLAVSMSSSNICMAVAAAAGSGDDDDERGCRSTSTRAGALVATWRTSLISHNKKRDVRRPGAPDEADRIRFGNCVSVGLPAHRSISDVSDSSHDRSISEISVYPRKRLLPISRIAIGL